MNMAVDHLDGYLLEEIEERLNRFLGSAPGRGRSTAMYT